MTIFYQFYVPTSDANKVLDIKEVYSFLLNGKNE
jgi:hypothetical protein